MMTVAQLIALLQTMPQDVPVTGYNGAEYTDFVTERGVKFEPITSHRYTGLRLPDGKPYNGPIVDIMGL